MCGEKYSESGKLCGITPCQTYLDLQQEIPHWVVYDGSFESLPELGQHVLIERGENIKTCGRRALWHRDGRSVWTTHCEHYPWTIQIGDRWMAWPQGRKVMSNNTVGTD